MQLRLLQYLLIILPFTTAAQTNVSGGIYQNTVWTVANSPYIVTGEVNLFTDYTLTIEPGVTVKFNDDAMLDCRGTLVAIGTATDSITFTSNAVDPVRGSWRGIKVSGPNYQTGFTNQVRMEYCKGMYAVNFIDLDHAYQGPYIFNHCYFYKNKKVNYDGGMRGTFFNYCRFQANESALNYIQFGGRVKHSEFFDNENGVDGFENVDSCVFYNNTNIALAPYGSATGNKVYQNNIGVKCYFNGVNNKFVLNEVHDNIIGVDLMSFFNGAIDFQLNSICNNSLYNIKNSGINDADLSNNCWCVSDSLQIRSSIYDGYVDPSVGLVSFTSLHCSDSTSPGPIDTTTTTDTTSIGDSSRINTTGMRVYPNPVHFNGSFNIVINKEITNGVLQVFNAMGLNVHTQTFTGSSKSINIRYAPGFYYVQVKSGKEKWVKKFYVQ